MNNADRCIDLGLIYISNQQRNDGGFDMYASLNQHKFQVHDKLETIFGSALIGLALKDTQTNAASKICETIADYLLKHRSFNAWSFNYWEKDSVSSIKRPYPDDLDDTFCALSVIHHAKPALFTGKAMADIASILFAAESEVGGPYKTWLVPDSDGLLWQDIDPAVNANIAAFLQKHQVNLPHLNTYLERQFVVSKLKSDYYPNSYSAIYFMSQWYKGEYINQINGWLLSMQGHDYWGGPHQASLCLITLLRNDYDPTKLKLIYQYIIDSQRPEGSWEASAAWIDSHNNDQPVFAGSKAYTTALCIKAVQLFRDSNVSSQKVAKTDDYYTSIKLSSQKIISEISHTELRNCVESIFDRIIERDKDMQILQMPQMISQSISTQVDKQTQLLLSSVSLWGWMAYTTYDDIMDEGINRLQLPGANYCLRRLSHELNDTMPDNLEFQLEVGQIMDRLDAANAWEAEYCRATVKDNRIRVRQLPEYGNYWQLADRSLGHTIAGLGVLYAAGYDRDSKVTQSLRNFFNHYLIARQLNDDAHDWEEDLYNGHINSVGVCIVKKYLELHGATKKVIDLKKDGDLLRSIMWNGVIIDICNQIERQIKLAKNAINNDNLELNPEIYMKMLLPIEKAVKNTLVQRSRTLQFLNAL